MRKKNYLITGILLIGVSLLLWNCESDYEISHSQEVTENKKLDYSLEKISYSELINDKKSKNLYLLLNIDFLIRKNKIFLIEI